MTYALSVPSKLPQTINQPHGMDGITCMLTSNWNRSGEVRKSYWARASDHAITVYLLYSELARKKHIVEWCWTCSALFSRSRSFPRWHHGREGWIFTSFATVKLRCVNLHAFTRFSHVRLWIFTFFTFSPSIGCEFSCFSRSRVWNHFTSFAIFTSPGANFHVFTFAGVDICDFYVHRCQFSMASRFSRCRAWDFTLFAIFTFLGVDSVFSRFHGLKPIFEAKSLF